VLFLSRSKMKLLLSDFILFLQGWYRFLFVRLYQSLRHLENAKSSVAEKLYEGRGKFVRPLVHSGMGGLVVLGIILAPIIANSLPGGNSFAQTPPPSAVLSSVTEAEEQTTTQVADSQRRAKVIDYSVQSGDTLSGIAQKFQISAETIKWANDLGTNITLKPGQTLKIPPITGIVHKVQRSDTVYSIAKRYSIDPQGIVDYPFNTFTNDETFALAVGQILIVPDGQMPQPQAPRIYVAQQTPNAGTITTSGIFIWPTTGRITQYFSWYHKAIDIANSVGTPILAADAGTITVAGWPDNVGYGNRVMINHGNGYLTLYAHLSKVLVNVGQTVKRGDLIGLMGSSGRSTGPHCHFEIRLNDKNQNPLAYLK